MSKKPRVIHLHDNLRYSMRPPHKVDRISGSLLIYNGFFFVVPISVSEEWGLKEGEDGSGSIFTRITETQPAGVLTRVTISSPKMHYYCLRLLLDDCERE